MFVAKFLKSNSKSCCKYYDCLGVHSSKNIQKRQSFCSLLVLTSDPLLYNWNRNFLLKQWTRTEISMFASNHMSFSKLETLPASIRYLIIEEDENCVPSYPSITKMSRLVRKLNGLRVDADKFEEKLLSVNYLKFHHPVKNYILDWKQSLRPYKSERQIIPKHSESFDNFGKLIDSYISLENIRAHSDVSDRLNYTLVCWRLSDVMECILDVPNLHQKEISLLERVCKQIARDEKIYTMLYFYWINLLRNGSVYCVRKASRITRKYPDIVHWFLDDLRNYCYEIHEGQNCNVDLPKSFDIEKLILSSHHLPWSDLMCNEISTMALKTHMSLIFWYADMPSRSFSLLSEICRDWVKKYDANDICSTQEIDLLTCLSAIIEDIVEEESEIGHGCLKKLLGETRTALPIFHYIYYVYLDQSHQSHNIAKKNLLLRECPDIMKLKDSHFESVLEEGIDNEMRRGRILSFLKNISHKIQEYSTIGTICSDTSNRRLNIQMFEGSIKRPEGATKSGPEKENLIKEQASEVRLQELLGEGNYKNAIDLYAQMSVPSNKVTVLITQSIIETNDTKWINDLRSILPMQSILSDELYVKEHDIKTNEIYFNWQENKSVDYLYTTLLRYETVLVEEYCVTSPTFQVILKKIRSVLRDLSRDLMKDHNLEVGHISNLELLKSCGIKFSNLYQDNNVLSIYYETLFFANKSSRKIGEEFLAQHPNVPRNVDIDAMLVRAMTYKTDEFFPKILEFCLRFDLDNYKRSKVVGQWIIYQCEKGNSEGLKKATELMNTAKDLNIPLSADALQDCIELENNLAGLSSLITKITSVILGNKNKTPKHKLPKYRY